MLVKSRLFNVFVAFLLVINLALVNVSAAFADDGTPPEPTPTVAPTEDPITPSATETATPESEVTETPTPEETATLLPEETVPPAEEAEPVGLLSQLPENTEIVVLDQNGESVPLTSEAALNTILDTDPMWCPAGVLPGPGCTMNFPDIGSLIADMITNTPTYDENGIIYFTVTPSESFSLTTASLGISDFNTLNDFNLTLQGGWNGLNGAAATFTDQTNFAANTITIGTLANPWVGNITLNNFTFNGVSSTSAVTVYTTTGNITLDNVDVAQQTGSTNTALLNTTSGNITVQNGSTFDGNNSAPPTNNGQSSGFFATTGTGSINISDTTFQESRQNGGNTFDGATLSAPIVTLNNVTSQNNDGDGITINNANVVTLNNVTATGNGTDNGSTGLTNNDGSGVLVNGNPGSKVIIIGGTFTNNQEYGVEVGSAANTTVYVQSNPTCTGNDSNSPLPTGAGSCYNTSSILDTTPPVITPAITGTAGANGWYTSDVNVNWSVTDTQSGIASSTGCSVSSQTIETTGVTLTCSATNNAGLSASNSVTIKIDKSNPTATLAVIAGTLGSNGWYTSDVTLQTSGTDSISGPVTCTANQSQTTETTGATFNGSCVNNAGLTTNASSIIIKLDKTIPVIAFVSRTPANANGWNNTDVTVNWSCTDSLSGAVSASINQTISTEAANQSTTGTCQDLAGNTISNIQSGISIDKTNPTLSLPSSMAVEATSPSGALANYSASASDNLDPSPIFGCVPTSGSAFAMGTTTVNCTATDQAGNVALGSFNVSVQDTAGPAIASHLDVTAEATSASGATATYTSPTTSDAIDGAGTATCSPASGSVFALGNTVVTCNATDSNSNAAIPTSFIVHVVDTTAPVIAAHADVTAEATVTSGATVTYTSPATSDAVDGAGTATCSPASGTIFALGDTTVTCNATDANGNPAIPSTFVVHVVDTTAPIIAAHTDVTVEATSSSGATVTYTNPATSDVVDGAGIALCSPASGNTFPLGNTTITCNATDANGNSAIPSTFVVHVVDTTAPIIIAHTDLTAEATSSSGATVTYINPTTFDVVDSAGTATCSPASSTVFALGNTTVTCNATDANGNAALSTTFVVHVVDTTAPVIAAHANVTGTTNNNLGMVATYSSPTTSDAVDGLGTASCVPTSGSFFPVGNILVSCNATDAHGNIAQSTTFTVTVTYSSLPQSQPQSTSSPQPQQGNNGFNIPVTGGNTFELDCLSIAYVFGIKITFHNLCDYQAMITSIDADTLPSQLPDGFSFVKALNVAVLFDGILVKALPVGTGLQLDFRIPANSQEQFTVLLWDSEANNAKGEWLDVTQLVQDKDLTKVMFNEKDDELYHIAPIETLKAFYRIITADKTGTFVLVKK